MKLDKDALEKLEPAIRKTWDAIAGDCDFVEDNAECLELCIDANRLATFSDKESDELVHDLCKRFGYDKVLKWLDKNIQLY